MNLSEAFKEWVANQPAEQTINHGSWNHCACGLFASTLPENVSGWRVADDVRVKYGHTNYNILGNGGLGPRGKLMADIRTYGGLSAWLNTLEPVKGYKDL